MLKFAIIGLGGLGKVHLNNAVELEKERGDIKLVALCDVEESRFTEKIKTNLGDSSAPVDLSCYNLYTDADEMLEKEKLDFVITALPTYLHEKVAVSAMKKGLHVFSEKPMARTIEQCQSMLNCAKENNRLLMIGQCLRYMPRYIKLKEYIDSEQFGKVIRADFSRLSLTPTWTWQNWMMDYEKCGGAALDMHIHDVDFINYAFGMPAAVRSYATHSKTKFESIVTTYEYADKLVTATADWAMADSYPFTPLFTVRFEKAVVEMDRRSLKVYPVSGEPYEPETVQGNAYKSEVDDFINCILENRESKINTPQSTYQTMLIAAAEIESAEKGERIGV